MEQPGPTETQAVSRGLFHPAGRLQLGLFLGGIVFCLLSIWLLDEPIAWFFARHWRQYPLHSLRIGTAAIVAPLALLVPVLGFGGRDSKLGESLTLAAYSALSAVAVNDFVWKTLFARQDVKQFLHGAGGFFRATEHDYYSFPSGHSVLVAAILAVLWRQYPRWRLFYAAAMVLVALLLLAGNWHFLSDIIAGALWGALVAQITMFLWRARAPVS